MAAYSLTRYSTPPKPTIDEVVALLETKLETVDDAKTIRLVDVERMGTLFVGTTLYDT